MRDRVGTSVTASQSTVNESISRSNFTPALDRHEHRVLAIMLIVLFLFNAPLKRMADRYASNLFNVHGSVFVTSGGVNPTSTIQAVALYVADQIKARLANLFD